MITSFQTRRMYQALAVVIGTFIYGAGVTIFLKPIGIMPGGLAGISQIINIATRGAVPSGIFLVVLNIPLLIFGWRRVSHRFTILSIVALLITMTTFDHVHYPSPLTDKYLNILLGSILSGFGMGLALRFGGSLGGTDVIANYLSIQRGKSTANISLSINAIVILLSGVVQQSFDKAILTFVSMFIVMEVINFIHTRHEKMLFLVISDNEKFLVSELLLKVKRGITVLDGVGAYSNTEKKIILMTVSSYQLYMTQQIITEIDPSAFVNVLPVKGVNGNFKSSVSF